MNNQPYKVLDKNIYFKDASEAQQYAKINIGTTIVRNLSLSANNNIQQEDYKIKKIQQTPSVILDYLNSCVISQDEAKRVIALNMYYHSLKLKYNTNKDVSSNGPVMIVGPTGSGKTFIVQKACEFINTLFIHVDTSSMVPEGIKGYSISSLAQDILVKAKYNISKASHCVVFFDEMDKLFNSEDASKYGLNVASQLLRLIEGTKVQLPNENLNKNKIEELDTSNIQFILGGAFQWILDEKSKDKVSVGFSKQEVNKKDPLITLEDLYQEDIPKELLGRMTTIVNLKKLTKEDFFILLKNEKISPLKEFIQKIEFHGDRVEISDETLHEMAQYAVQSDLGVRGLKQIIQRIFSEALFNASDEDYKTHIIKYAY